VLVLDADMVPALTISRSLARKNCVIDVAASSKTPIASYSNRVDTSYLYPDPLSLETEFLQWVIKQTRDVSYDLVIPVTERSLVPISNNRALFEHVRIAMPSRESLELALDKEQTMALAERVDVPIPQGISLSAIAELEQHLPHLKYPVVLKPVRSLGTNDKGSSQLKVSYAFDEIGLRAGCEHSLKFGPVLLQQYFKGQGVGVELIARAGEILYAFQHLRLHEVPVSGGGSTLRQSVPLEPKLLAAAERLVTDLNWNGVAMVEFKWNPETKEFCLMEINGRFWGSLPLADAAGADFPAMLLDLELNDKIELCEPYKTNVYCRKLASDLYWYEAVLRAESESGVTDVPNFWTIFKELRLLFLPRHYFDVQSFSDPIPGLIDLRIIASSYVHRFGELAQEKLFLWRQKRAWRKGEVAKAISQANTLLFICYGNINRSALADVLLGSYAEDSGLNVISAGFHKETGRPADPVMVDVARQHHMNLASSRSIEITPEIIQQSDIIFAMEKVHVDALMALDPSCADRTWLLGAHGGKAKYGAEIGDPYGRSKDTYEFCYRRIAEAVDNIKGVLAFRRGE
jgi:protein-tyrosine-phosphatase/predicted ATP-grasp superfamily ATP-dependent carboligase